MTLDEFYKKLSVQKNAQSTNLINPDFNTNEMSNTIRNIQANRNMQNSQSSVNKIISNNPNVREVLRAPVSQTINQKLNIDPSKLEHKNTIFEDMGNVGKNLWNGIKSSGYNIANSIPKLFNAIDEGINGGTPEEYYDKIMLKDLKNLGVDGSNMSIDEKVNTLKDIWGEAHINKYKTKYKTEEELENAYNKVLSKTDNDISKMTLLEKENLLKKLSGDEIFNSIGYSKYKGNNDFDALMSEENIEKVDNKLRSIDEDIARNIENTNNPILKKGAELAPSIASNATTGALSLINPAIGTTAFSASAMNSYARQGKEELGLSDSASVLYGTILSGMESVTEGFELSKFSKATKGLARAQGKKQIKEAIKDYLMNIGTNYIQEAMMEPIQETTNQAFVGESNWDNMIGRMNESGINGALSSAILDAGSSAIAGGINIAYKTKDKSQGNIRTQVFDKINNNELFDKNTRETLINSINNLDKNNLNNLNTYLDNAVEIINKLDNKDTSNDIQNKLDELKKIDTSKMGLIEKTNIKREIRALEAGYTNVEDYLKVEELKKEQAKLEYEKIQKNKITNVNEDSNIDYMMQHRPTKNGVGYDITSTDSIGKDIYTNPENYVDMSLKHNQESYKALVDIRDNPNAEVTIYRASPKNELNQGDWITLSKTYAEMESQKENVPVNEFKVKAKDIQFAGDDINEFGYFPQKSNIIDEKVSNYIESIKDNFTSDVDIDTSVVTDGNVPTSDYKNTKEVILRNRAKELFRKIGRRVFNNNNEKIYVTNTDISESIRKTITNPNQKNLMLENLAVFSKLDEIIENGKEISSSAIDIKNREQYSDYKYYVTNARVNGKNCVVEFDTRVQEKNNGMKERHFRLERIYEINKGDSATGADIKSTNQFGTESPINNIIPSEQNYVNNDKNGIKNTENEPFNPEFKGKERKRYQTIINSDVVSKEAKAIAKELMGVDTYIPETNVQQLNKADYTIEQLGVDRTLENLKSKLDGGQRILAEDIAIGDRLIQYYSKTGERQKLQDAIQYTAMAGTEAGRTVQAMAMIAHQSPEGQALWIQRSINKLNQKIASKKGAKVEIIDGKQVVTKNGKILEKVQLFEFTSDMQESILSAKSNEELYDILDNIYEELGGQVTKNTFEKLDSWRYFSMLANPTTHVRNIVGNTAMTGTQGVKNKIAGGIEDIVAIFNKDMKRTKSLVRRADAETVKFAKDDIKNVADRLGLNQNKYSPTSRIEGNKKEFKSDILNKTLGNAYKLNSKLLEVEDGWGLKYNYAKALSSYISSNKIDVNNITDAQLGKARNYAINQAKEATFHQESKLASALNQIGNNNEVAKFVLDSTVPFKAVPINVAKTGLAYSPLQLAKSVTTDLVNLRNGNITVNQYIDNLSKGLTGTGIALIGYVLAGMGILKANGTDDDKEKYDEAQGNQIFSVTIGTQNFSLSWLAPTAIPLFIGAEMNEMLNSNKENKGNLEEGEYDKVLNLAKNTVDVFANAMNPMTEMSMLSGLTSTFRSYDQDNYLVGIGTNIAKSYVNQYVPTALGKIARITDEYERDTTSTKSGTIPKAIDSTKNQMMSKVPILRQMLPVKKDTWGKEVKSPTLPVRIFENTLAPYTRKEISNDKVDKYLNRLYDKTKSKDLLPDTISKTLIFDGSTYRYTNEEYNKYKAEFGKSAHDKITNVMNNKTFNKLTDDEKVDIINKIYSDCKEEVKEEYAKVHKIEYERSDKNIEIEEEIKKGLDMSNAYIYKTIISKKESDKNEDGNTISSSATKNKLRYIMGMEIDDKQKQHLINISTNDTDYDVSLKDLKKLNEDYLTYLQQSGKKPEKGGLTEREEYMQLINSGIPVKQLNKYYSEKGDIEGVKDSSGKTISGSKKQAIFNYVNSLSLSIPQKQILLARENESFAKLYYNDIINYINNLNISNTEKSKMYDAIFKKIK